MGSLVAQMSEELRSAVIVGAVVGLVLTIATLAIVVRNVTINRRRRSAGQGRLAWGRIADTELRARSLAGEGSDEAVADALRLRRQIEWEREQAAHEMSKYGRSRVRAHCPEHDRWCKYPERGPHPPGGIDNETVPDDWHPVGEGPPPVAI